MKKYKFGLLVPLLLLLSGCSYVYQDIFIGIKFINMGVSIPTWDTFFSKIGLDITNWLNSLYAWLNKSLFENIENLSEQTLSYLGSFSGMESVLKTVVLLGVVAMVVRLAAGIVKHYMMEADDAFAPEGITLIKRILVGMAMLVLIPYMVISPFVASSFLGSKLSESILSNQEGTYTYEIYDVMNEYGIKPSTYCEVGQLNTKNSSSMKHLSTKSPNVEVITKETASNFPLPQKFIDHNPKFANANNDLYGFWCGGGDGHASNTSLNVWTSLFLETDYFDNTTLVNGGETVVDLIVNVAQALVVGFVAFFALFAIAKRVSELIFLLVVSWWHISASVSDGVSLSLLGKKITTLCLSQFMLILEFAIFLTICQMPSGVLGLVFKVPLMFAATFVILSTPTAIREIVQDTGTAGQAMTGIGRFIK